MREYKIIDSDSHVIETDATWSYLEKCEYNKRPKLYESKDNRRQYWVLNDKAVGVRFPSLTEKEVDHFSKITHRNMRVKKDASEMNNVELRLKQLDQLGIDIQILHNTIWLEQVSQNESVEVALSYSWNQWMMDIWKKSENRLYWSCVFPISNIHAALDQIKECKMHGAVAIFMRGYEKNFANTDPYFYPIYELASKLDMAIIIHASNGNMDNCNLLKNYPGGFVRNAFTIFRIPVMVSCYNILMSDLPKLFPNLRWGFIEATAQWIPWVYTEAKNRLMEDGIELLSTAMDQFSLFVSCQTTDDLPWIFKYSTTNTIVVGTDFGHIDPASDLNAISNILNRNDLNRHQKKKILHDNPAKLYGIKV